MVKVSFSLSLSQNVTGQLKSKRERGVAYVLHISNSYVSAWRIDVKDRDNVASRCYRMSCFNTHRDCLYPFCFIIITPLQLCDKDRQHPCQEKWVDLFVSLHLIVMRSDAHDVCSMYSVVPRKHPILSNLAISAMSTYRNHRHWSIQDRIIKPSSEI